MNKSNCVICNSEFIKTAFNRKVCDKIPCKEKLLQRKAKKNWASQTRTRKFLMEYRKCHGTGFIEKGKA